jgi:hypothetical protein
MAEVLSTTPTLLGIQPFGHVTSTPKFILGTTAGELQLLGSNRKLQYRLCQCILADWQWSPHRASSLSRTICSLHHEISGRLQLRLPCCVLQALPTHQGLHQQQHLQCS